MIKLDRLWLTGIAFLAASLLVFCFPSWLNLYNTDGLFTVNYLLAVLYLIILTISGRLKRGRNGLPPLFIFLLLFLVSCYALNRSVAIFQQSVPWWSIVLIISGINYISIAFYSRLPRWTQYLICFIAGISLCAFLYLAIYLMPIYLISAAATLALGLGMHSFIPLLFIIYTLLFLAKTARDNRRTLLAAFGGVAVALLVVLQFSLRWKAGITRVENDLDRTEESHLNNLPPWVSVAQDCRPSTFNEHFLKTGLVYESSSTWNWELFDVRSHRYFNERRKHDPLIMIATFFYGASRLGNDDRIKVLESLFDSRHAAQERLWSDDALTTTAVKTSVELWPRLHLSYTEQELTITNNTLHPTWFDKGEALYTFHLPEGAAVTSLSLWINGHEEKGIFTSRHKADTAYRSIARHESDPSVVHWQEGNNVIVRVFPIPPHGPRRFKIGITAPLEKEGGRLVYHNTWFDGPPADDATASVRVHAMQPLEGLQTPANFPGDDEKNLHVNLRWTSEPDKNQSLLETEGNYLADWSLSFLDPGITPQTFRFNGQQYTAGTATPVFAAADIRAVYLDLNKSWTPDEYTALLAGLHGRKVYAWQPNGGLIELTPASADLIFRQCENLQFSLFPLPVISDKEHSLLISKSAPSSPALSDLNNSDYAARLHAWLAAPGKLRIFTIGRDLSPYLKTLRECGAFAYDNGSWQTCYRRLAENRFLVDTDRPDLYTIDPAGLLICKTSSDNGAALSVSRTPQDSVSDAAQAPDHLLRLFAYRRIQQTLKGHLPGDYTDEDEPTVDSLVQTAQEAGIVSPVSSLVVLEKPEDYKTFDIAESEASLKNASLRGQGAVPEPGEWAVLGVALAFFLVIRLRSARTSTNAKV